MTHVAVPFEVSAFAAQGFAVLPSILPADEVKRLNEAIDVDLAANRSTWFGRGEGHLQNANLLPRTEAFVPVIEQPTILASLAALMGETVCFEELSAMLRDPMKGDPGAPSWHRDFNREDGRPLGVHALSVVYYLTDVGPEDHCFSIVPGTHDEHYSVKAGEHDAASEFDVNGPAGTALIFHTACIHAARLKPRSRQRRTLHLYYGHADNPRLSHHTDIPDSVLRRDVAGLPGLYTDKPRQGAGVTG